MLAKMFVVSVGLVILFIGAALMVADFNRLVPYINVDGETIPEYKRIDVDTYPLFYRPTFSVWDEIDLEYVTVKGSMTLDFFQVGVIVAVTIWVIVGIENYRLFEKV